MANLVIYELSVVMKISYRCNISINPQNGSLQPQVSVQNKEDERPTTQTIKNLFTKFEAYINKHSSPREDNITSLQLHSSHVRGVQYTRYRQSVTILETK